jgi:hypothetical protein
MSSDWTRCRTIVRAQNRCQYYRSLQKEKGLRTRVFLKYRTVGSRSSEMYEACCILYLKRIWSSWSGTPQWIKCLPKGCGFESRRLPKNKSRYFMISYNQKWRCGSIGRTLGFITKTQRPDRYCTSKMHNSWGFQSNQEPSKLARRRWFDGCLHTKQALKS